MSRMKRNGFTLIELMIVTVIIGILAGIAIPNFIAMRNRAKEGSTKATMTTVQLAAEDYSVQYDGAYPKTIDQLLTCLPEGKKLKNAFTKELTEPSNGSGPGAIDYIFTPDSAGFGKYAITGHGTIGQDLGLTLTSAQ